jgi:MYM-type Zinc finger with FCS sequence motif
MRDALPPSPSGLPRYGFTCQACHQVITTEITGLFHNPNRGSIQRFCSPACRQAAYRRRRAGTTEDQPRQHHGGKTRSLKHDQKAQGGSLNMPNTRTHKTGAMSTT